MTTTQARNACGAGTSAAVLAIVGERLRAVRLRRGLRQEDVSIAAGFNRAYLSIVESGKRNVPVGTLVRIARVLDVDPAELVAGLHRVGRE